MLTRIDLWIGKHLFVPIIIRVCQAAGIGQFRFYRYAWASALTVFVWKAHGHLPWVAYWLIVISATVSVVIAALWPDLPSETWLSLRIWFLMCTAVNILAANWAGASVVFIALAAEYALTIKTIPPRETERKRALAANLRRTR